MPFSVFGFQFPFKKNMLFHGGMRSLENSQMYNRNAAVQTPPEGAAASFIQVPGTTVSRTTKAKLESTRKVC